MKCKVILSKVWVILPQVLGSPTQT